jgi:phosphoenolpyruvate carboxylase
MLGVGFGGGNPARGTHGSPAPLVQRAGGMMDIGILTADPAKIRRDLEDLVACFQEVLEEAGHGEVAACLPWRAPGAERRGEPAPELLAQASSIAFVLLTMVEQNATAAYRRDREDREGLDAVPSLWGAVLAELPDRGVPPADVARALAEIQVEIVLTAHPTEAKRATVLEHHRHLYRLLSHQDRGSWTATERATIRDEIKAWLALLWRTGEIFLEKPDVASERRNVSHYLTEILPHVLAPLDQRVRQAWAHARLDPSLLDPTALPRVRAGTWVGGDRDGHPLVTADVTRETLRELRLHALVRLHADLRDAARKLSLSDHLQAPPDALRERVDTTAQRLGETGLRALRRNPDETWRQLINLMVARLPAAVELGGGALAEVPGGYGAAAELLDDLALLRGSLLEVGADRVARELVDPLVRRVQSFGFHLAVLDVRQNSQFHDRALAQLLVAAGVDAADYPEWDEERRRALLTRELEAPRPLVRSDRAVGPEADAVLASLRVLVDHLHQFGPDGLGALIVSMTRDVSDLLAVYVFAREVGLEVPSDEGPACPLPVVPLFETIDDLRRSPEILRAYLDHPVARRRRPRPPDAAPPHRQRHRQRARRDGLVVRFH